MKQLKPLLWVMVGCAFSGMANGQLTGASVPRFALHLGPTLSNMNWNQGSPPPATPIRADWQAGFSIGVSLRVKLGERLSLQPEYNFDSKNGKDLSTGASYQLSWLAMPVLLHYQLRRVSLFAGPEAAILIAARQTVNGVKSTITHDTEERSIAGVAGLRWQFYHNFFVSGRYFQGFNHIGIGQRSSVKEFKYQGAGLSLGLLL